MCSIRACVCPSLNPDESIVGPMDNCDSRTVAAEHRHGPKKKSVRNAIGCWRTAATKSRRHSSSKTEKHAEILAPRAVTPEPIATYAYNSNSSAKPVASPVAESLLALSKVRTTLPAESDVASREAALLCGDFAFLHFRKGKKSPDLHVGRRKSRGPRARVTQPKMSRRCENSRARTKSRKRR